MDLSNANPKEGPTILRMLLEHGADVKARDNDGETPLTTALSQTPALPVTIRLLLKHGADPNVRTKKGKTVLQLAQQYHRPDILAMLKRAGAKK